MNHVIVFTMLLLCIGTGRSQTQIDSLVTCKYKQFTWLVKNDKAGEVFSVYDSIQQTVDTVSIGFFDRVRACKCSDSLSAFLTKDGYIGYFKYDNQKWKYWHAVGLPDGHYLEYISVLIEGEQYEYYTHQLIDVDRVVSQLIVLQLQGGIRVGNTLMEASLGEVARYDIEFKITPAKIDFSKPSNEWPKQVTIVKKTLIEK